FDLAAQLITVGGATVVSAVTDFRLVAFDFVIRDDVAGPRGEFSPESVDQLGLLLFALAIERAPGGCASELFVNLVRRDSDANAADDLQSADQDDPGWLLGIAAEIVAERRPLLGRGFTGTNHLAATE